MKRSAAVGLGLLLLTLFFYGSFLVHKINLVTTDLGRHLKNGQTFFSDPSVLRKNFYSYSEPDFPVVNHHWLSGVVFHLLQKAVGFEGLEIFFVAVCLGVFSIFFRLAQQRAGPALAAVLALAVTPILAVRSNIRPEVFSYAFAALFFLVLERVRAGRWSGRALFVLPALEVFWVNMHIYFPLGPLIIGTFLVEALAVRELRRLLRPLAAVFAASIAATLVNPSGFQGALAPFTILGDYGYRLIENQPVWIVAAQRPNAVVFVFEAVFALLALSFLTPFVLRWRKGLSRGTKVPEDADISNEARNVSRRRSAATEDAGRLPSVRVFLLAAGFSAMALYQFRNLALFGFFALPFLAENIGQACRAFLERRRRILEGAAAVLAAGVFLASIAGGPQRLFDVSSEFGLGLRSGESAAAEFFKKENLHGPVFNNYDIGGYLIFHLFPRERVFVDNRPEAYGADFFRQTFIPMQLREAGWREVDGRYHFNAIMFSLSEATPWGHRFLIARVNDPGWAPVFLDKYALMFVRRNEANRGVIERYEVPKDRFRIVRPEIRL